MTLRRNGREIEAAVREETNYGVNESAVVQIEELKNERVLRFPEWTKELMQKYMPRGSSMTAHSVAQRPRT